MKWWASGQFGLFHLLKSGCPLTHPTGKCYTSFATTTTHLASQLMGHSSGGKVIHLFRASERMSEVEFYENREAWGWAERMYARTSEITYDTGDIYDYEGYPAR